MAVGGLNQERSPNILPFLLIILLILGGILLITVENGSHSIERHGAEAVQIQETLDCQGSFNQWHSRSWRTPNKFFQTCQLDDGRWGFRVVDKIRGQWREITSFVPGDGSYAHLVEYLSAIAKEVVSEVQK